MERVRKYSRKRDAILDCIRRTKCHPTAEWVYQQLKAEYPDLSLGTVYRNISLFKEEGRIRSIGVVNGLEHYDGILEPHAHFICTCCGAVRDVEAKLPPSVLEEAESQSGGVVNGYQLQFFGVCAGCKGINNQN